MHHGSPHPASLDRSNSCITTGSYNGFSMEHSVVGTLFWKSIIGVCIMTLDLNGVDRLDLLQEE